MRFQTPFVQSAMCSPASFSVVFVEAEITNPTRKADFEQVMRASLLANMIIYFFYR